MQLLKREPIEEEMEEEADAGSLVDSVSLDDVSSMEPVNTCDVIVKNISHCSEPGRSILLQCNCQWASAQIFQGRGKFL